jgi:hypothetical protein
MPEDHILIAHSRLRRARYRMSALGTAAVVGIASLIASPVTSSAQVPAASGAAGAGVHANAASSAKPPVFAYYYLWWSANHWRSALGSNYPTGASPHATAGHAGLDRMRRPKQLRR